MTHCLKTITSKAGSLLRSFSRDGRGNVAMITGLAAIPLFVAAGVAIDVARASRSQNALQVAVDAAALAVAASDKASLAGLDDAQKAARKAELKKLAENFVKANYKDQGTDLTVNVNVTDDIITVDANKAYPTSLMNIAKIKSVDLAARAEVNLQGGIAENIEIVLVMDTTGSMDDNNKMEDAQAAAKQLLQTVLDDAASDDKVKFALVPFSGSVNVGADKLNSGWIDTTGKTSVSKVNFTSTTYHNMKAWDDMKYVNLQGLTIKLPWNGCVEARLGNYAVNDTAPSAGTPDTLFTPYMAPDEASNSFDNNYITGESGGSDSAKQKNQAKYATKIFTSLTGDKGPWRHCAASSIVPLTHSRAAIEAGIDAMVPRGPTILPEGMAWGWRVLSPTAPYTEGASFTDKKWRKVVVFMTDGMNDPSAGNNGFNNSVYTSYGYVAATLAKNRFGTTTANQAVTKLNDKLTTTCTNLKALAELRDNPKDRSKKVPSIEIYTIAFQAPEASKTLLRSCATAEGYFIDASSGQQLKDAFKAIGARLKTMYLSK
jgi:Flp pilus assembly protein TadG